LAGTCINRSLFYFRSLGVAIHFTDVEIEKFAINEDEIITKIAQRRLVIPIAIMMMIVYYGRRNIP
jgi:hypothetical protein